MAPGRRTRARAGHPVAGRTLGPRLHAPAGGGGYGPGWMAPQFCDLRLRGRGLGGGLLLLVSGQPVAETQDERRRTRSAEPELDYGVRPRRRALGPHAAVAPVADAVLAVLRAELRLGFQRDQI